MKKYYTFFLIILTQIFGFAQQQTATYSVSPSSFNEDQSVTITINGSSINESTWGITNNALYIWAWSYDTATNTSMDCPTNGTWTASNTANKFTYNSGTDTYTMTFVPNTFFNRTGINKMGFLVKALDGTGDKKSQDIYLNIGTLQFTATSPNSGTTTFVNNGGSYPISYSTSIAANYVLKKSDGTVVYTSNGVSSIFYPYTVNEDTNLILTVTNPADNSVLTSSFTLALTPSVQTVAKPAYIRQGINYDPADPTKVGLAIYAPNKTFVHVIGSFNNWTVSSNYLMKRDDTDANLYWIEITGLTAQQVYTFQYRTNDGIKVADPFSRLVLSPDDDPYISATTYPNKPVYPAGQQYDVSVVQTGISVYPWVVTNFTKPEKQNLIVYEALVRDFTTEQTWQSMIDKISYLKSLKINAIELMPIMEFDGNNSWGYNTGFHYALDKAYGTPEKLKEFIDLCHQNGIAVILDIALNHATGRSPIERLWSTSTNGGYGDVAANNPYFNQTAMHSYSVFYDLNHSKSETKYYVSRVLEQWITEYKIDGFRWDLTKGFTQACTSSDQTCTNAYQQDRVDILKGYVDAQWSFDPTSIAIFEHLGIDSEEKQWADYRLSEGKGVLMWDIQNSTYNENTMGQSGYSNFSRVDYEAHTFSDRRANSYGESHDEERLMFKNLAYGATNGSYDVKDLATALTRQKAYGAVFLTVPGPKMIWQFGELGYDKSIFTCSNGAINNQSDSIPGDCKLDPKTSAFAMFYDQDLVRKSIYDTWAKILQIRLANPVFDTKTFTVQSGNLTPRIFIWNDALPSTSLKNVVILANFTLVTQNIVPNFPYTGTWYNLMDNSPLAVTNTTNPVTLEPGEFRIFGNGLALGTSEITKDKNALSLTILENPAINGAIKIRYTNAKNGVVTIFDMSGKALKSYKINQDFGDQTLFGAKLPAGMYLVQLKTNKGTVVEKLMVK